jgi:hypothetical protein
VTLVSTGAAPPRLVPLAGLRQATGVCMPDDEHVVVRGREGEREPEAFLVDLASGARRAVAGRDARLPCACGRTMIACLDAMGRIQIRALSGPAHPGAGLAPGLLPLRFTPDGASLLVSPVRTTRTEAIRIERVDIATGRRDVVREFKPVADLAGFWMLSPAAVKVTPDGRGYAFSYFQYLHNLYVADGFR